MSDVIMSLCSTYNVFTSHYEYTVQPNITNVCDMIGQCLNGCRYAVSKIYVVRPQCICRRYIINTIDVVTAAIHLTLLHH